MIDITRLMRENIRKLSPYSSARDEYSGKTGIFLDANENSFGSIPKGPYNRYPDPGQTELKQRISTLKGVETARIFLGNGSDEAIDLLMRVFCRPGHDNIVIMPPTYGMYRVAAEINDVGVIEVPLTTEFDIDTAVVSASVDSNTKLIFVCSPNNPTGNCFRQERIIEILEGFNGLVIVDEAYIDFCEKNGWLDQIDRYNNLIVLQTFSKAWGLAGLRVGMAFGDSMVITAMNKIKYPYNVNAVSQSMVLKALERTDLKDRVVRDILEQRNILRAGLESLNIVRQVFPSDANFLLARVRDANRVYRYLLDQGIIVRNRSNMAGCKDCLRFTVGTPQQNQALLAALKRFGDVK